MKVSIEASQCIASQPQPRSMPSTTNLYMHSMQHLTNEEADG